MKDKTFTAYYMPARNDKDPSKGGFLTENEAWDWIAKKHICRSCKKEIETNKKWEHSGKKYPPKSFFKSLEEEVDWHQKNVGSSNPACMCEWTVLEEDKCGDFGDIMDAIVSKNIKNIQKPKLVLHHDDPPCYERLVNGYCEKCKITPDTQSTCLYSYCPYCDVALKKMKCPKCKKTFSIGNK